MSQPPPQKHNPKLYACFVCRKNGFDNTMVKLAGRDENNKTIYLEPDDSRHVHKGGDKSKTQYPQQQQPIQQQQQQTIDIKKIERTLAEIQVKLDAIMSAVNAPPVEDPEVYRHEDEEP